MFNGVCGNNHLIVALPPFEKCLGAVFSLLKKRDLRSGSRNGVKRVRMIGGRQESEEKEGGKPRDSD